MGFVARHFAPLLARIIQQMAATGTGTDACLRRNCLPVTVNYYAPIPDLQDLEKRKVWDRRSDLTGIDFGTERQVRVLRGLGQRFGHECKWPMESTEDPYQFFTHNPSFSYGCAASLHCILREYQPQRVIEIGSGNSSLVISSALNRNTQVTSQVPEYIIIDPYPRPIIEHGLPCLTRLVKERVELLEVGFFDLLRKNDVLFVDGGHAVRTGSDVNHMILDVLPRLAEGVIVHFHDVFLPFEYPKVWATNARFRQFWTEAYLLQAFLCLNPDFEILLAMTHLMTEQKQAFQTAFPFYDPIEHPTISGSFWVRRKRVTQSDYEVSSLTTRDEVE
jgi:hypothetical protein